MSRNIILALIAASLVMTSSAYAGEWKRQSYQETPIQLDWRWASTAGGSYWERWDDSHKEHMYSAWWTRGTYPRIEIILRRLAPDQTWRSISKLGKKFLTNWNHLKGVGISKIRKIPCNAHECVAFEAHRSTDGGSDNYRCVGFKLVGGSLGTPDAAESPDIVAGYYCSGLIEDIATDTLNEILNSIAIKK